MNSLTIRTAAIVAATVLVIGCGSSGSSSGEEAPNAAEPATSETEPMEILPPAPPATQPDVLLDFSLEPLADSEAPWLLEVVATNLSNETVVDHDPRTLERWNGSDWVPVAVVPYNLSSAGKLLACEPDSPCDGDAAEALIPAQEAGEVRSFRMRPLEDGTYRMVETTNRTYSVTSNRITIEDAAVAE